MMLAFLRRLFSKRKQLRRLARGPIDGRHTAITVWVVRHLYSSDRYACLRPATETHQLSHAPGLPGASATMRAALGEVARQTGEGSHIVEGNGTGERELEHQLRLRAMAPRSFKQ